MYARVGIDPQPFVRNATSMYRNEGYLDAKVTVGLPTFDGDTATLPIEILIVFAVQIGKTIQPTTWYITLATAGAVLLVIAVSSERNSSGDRGVAARLRDLK